MKCLDDLTKIQQIFNIIASKQMRTEDGTPIQLENEGLKFVGYKHNPFIYFLMPDLSYKTIVRIASTKNNQIQYVLPTYGTKIYKHYILGLDYYHTNIETSYDIDNFSNPVYIYPDTERTYKKHMLAKLIRLVIAEPRTWKYYTDMIHTIFPEKVLPYRNRVYTLRSYVTSSISNIYIQREISDLYIAMIENEGNAWISTQQNQLITSNIYNHIINDKLLYPKNYKKYDLGESPCGISIDWIR